LNSGENLPLQEIVIIRRKYDDGDHGHHGGMWKIAFADFMTAMMAFFLVMWLISASDEKTLDQIATYFNPIKLPDTTKVGKSIQTASGSGAPDHRDEKKGVKKDLHETTPEAEVKEEKPKIPDEALFIDPYGVLSKLASQVVRAPLPPPQGLRKEDAKQFAGGIAFRDPFDPDFRKRSGAKAPESLDVASAASRDDMADGNALDSPPVAAPDAPDEGGDLTAPLEPAARAGFAAERAPGKRGLAEAKEVRSASAAGETPIAQAAKSAAGDKAVAETAVKPGTGDKPAPNAAESAPTEETAKRLEGVIRETLRQAGLPETPAISVERTAEGLLISLTDKMNFEMFNIASAQPRPELVVTLEQIGKLLLGRNGNIVVRGHTDSRAFRSGGYDNWRLSTDRAHMAHYMLARSGLPETRFERIEGYADRYLKVTTDPKAAPNRRIEILLRPPTS
jgi:chemotaxis protein MotB